MRKRRQDDRSAVVFPRHPGDGPVLDHRRDTHQSHRHGRRTPHRRVIVRRTDDVAAACHCRLTLLAHGSHGGDITHHASEEILGAGDQRGCPHNWEGALQSGEGIYAVSFCTLVTQPMKKRDARSITTARTASVIL